MITALFIITLAAFTYVESYCGYTLYKRGKWLSNKRQAERRMKYRKSAYAALNARQSVQRNRSELWRAYNDNII